MIVIRMLICDKCGQAVPADNDCSILDALVSGNPGIIMAFGTRHLLPVIEDGRVVCEGSPSRAQYLYGQPRDPRVAYAYDESYEPVFRAAYAELIQAAYRAVAPMN